MFYVYVLRSLKTGKLYTGWTPDLKARVKKHNLGQVKSTKTFLPYELVFYEAFQSEPDSHLRELFFKSGWGRKHLKEALKNTLAAGSLKGPPAKTPGSKPGI
jgi:putative endonuclease